MEYTEEEWENAHKSLRDPETDTTQEEIEILVAEGLKEYDGKFADNIEILIDRAHRGKSLSTKGLEAIQDVYAYLEDVNFHTELQAIEIYTNVYYV